MHTQELLPHLFRTEFSRICAVLIRFAGVDHLELAEDMASETFFLALETWPYKRIPENPAGWLHAVAKNKMLNELKRRKIFSEKISVQLRDMLPEESEVAFSEAHIQDSQLKMIFAVCHPALPAEAQVGLALRILCGFGISEIASAFLVGEDTIKKRLFRAREKLRMEQVKLEVPSGSETEKRMKNVLATLYLLFNEGYYSETHDTVLREDMCADALRLTKMLLAFEETVRPEVHALYALMCFHASRFPARKSKAGELILYEDQDTSLWSQEMIVSGAYHLHQSSGGNNFTRYHLEAAIAWWYTQIENTAEKWESILQLYNQLLMLEYSPVAALNRTFALSKARGNAVAIAEAEKLQLLNNQYYFVLLGVLYTGVDAEKAKDFLEQAYVLARSNSEKAGIRKRIDGLK